MMAYMGAEYYREYRKVHPPKLYTEEQKEAARVRSREWRKEHPGYSSEYFAERPGKRAEYRKNYREQDRLYALEYYRNHLSEFAARSAARRALILGATIGDLASIKEIYRQAKEDEPIRCYLCGELIPLGRRHVDHVHPLSKGGKHTATNLKIACGTCNDSKGSKMPEEVGVLPCVR